MTGPEGEEAGAGREGEGAGVGKEGGAVAVTEKNDLDAKNFLLFVTYLVLVVKEADLAHQLLCRYCLQKH